jgi:hypothetical protein
LSLRPTTTRTARISDWRRTRHTIVRWNVPRIHWTQSWRSPGLAACTTGMLGARQPEPGTPSSPTTKPLSVFHEDAGWPWNNARRIDAALPSAGDAAERNSTARVSSPAA